MADSDRDPSAPLSSHRAVADLVREPLAHDFFATLRRLQAQLPIPPFGTALRPGDEPVRFAQEPSLAFAASAIASASVDDAEGRLDVLLRFTGLLGPNGPMPHNLTEYILDRRRHYDDPTLEAFLNIFHHRIYTLFFRAWALQQPTVDHDRGGATRHETYLRSLFGLGLPGTTGRDTVPDAARIYQAGWLSGLARSPAGLAAILGDFLRVPVQVQSFQGTWMDLPVDSRCRLGASRATGVLGASCFAGERIWLAHLKFRIRFGPLRFTDYEKLLPGGPAFRQVRDWVRFYLGDELMWEAQLVLLRTEAPPCQLGRGARLGWTTWTGSPPLRDLDDLVVQGA